MAKSGLQVCRLKMKAQDFNCWPGLKVLIIVGASYELARAFTAVIIGRK